MQTVFDHSVIVSGKNSLSSYSLRTLMVRETEAIVVRRKVQTTSAGDRQGKVPQDAQGEQGLSRVPLSPGDVGAQEP
jgi:hypothetical protein